MFHEYSLVKINPGKMALWNDFVKVVFNALLDWKQSNHRFLFKKIIVRKTTAITTTSKKTLSLPEIWIKIIKLFI